MNLLDRLIRFALPLIPRSIVRRVASRYIAGSTLEQALATVRALGQEGAMATLDFLGEEVSRPEQAEAAAEEYLRALAAIHQAELPCNISVKPTLFGLRLGEDACLVRLARVAARAAELGSFVRLDMEDHTATDATLRIYRALRQQHGNVGVVLQSKLRRTLDDAATLAPLRANVRLCKGIYREPRSLAWQDAEVVRASYVYLAEKLLAGGCYVGLATHDELLVWASMAAIDRLQLPPERYELQMLLGVDPELRRIILQRGHRLRVYVPYGVDWYGYSVRRLRENPTIARHVVRALLSRPKAS